MPAIGVRKLTYWRT